MDLHFKYWPRVIFTGLGQIAFCDRAACGALVLLAAAIYSPWAAVGALVGAFIGTAVAYLFHTWNSIEKGAGLPVPNLAILGLVWGGFVPAGGWPILLILIAVVACLAVEQIIRRPLAAAGLPLLSLPAVLVLYGIVLAYYFLGEDIWILSPYNDWLGVGPLPSIGCVCAALALRAHRALVWTVGAAAVSASLSGLFSDGNLIGPVSLWGLVVAPACFGVHVGFLAGSNIGARAGMFAAALGWIIWILWQAGPLAALLPSLFTPLIVSVWGALILVRRQEGRAVTNLRIGFAAEVIRDARANGGKVAFITGAGASTASGIPDYVSGAWLDPSIPSGAYDWERFLDSLRCRRRYWEACNKFRQVALAVEANVGQVALARLQQAGWIDTVVTQNVDRLHQAAGSKNVIELHGRIDRVRCTGCGRSSDWPPVELWRRYDLRCHSCNEPLKPAVIAFGEPLPSRAWHCSLQAIEGCAVVVVAGTQLAVNSAAELVTRARLQGARVIFINRDPNAQTLLPDDVLIDASWEVALPALARLLDVSLLPTSPDEQPLTEAPATS